MTQTRNVAMHKCLFVPLLFCMLLFSHAAVGKNTDRIDDLKEQLSKCEQDTNRIRLLIEAATYYTLKANAAPRNIDSAKYFSEQALSLSRDLKQARYEGIALYLCAYKYRSTGRQKEAIDLIQKSVKLLSRYGMATDVAEAFLELGNCYSNEINSELVPKADAYERAETLFRQANDKKKYATALAAKADVYSYQGKSRESIDSMQKALAIYEQNHFSDIYLVYDLLGMKYGEQSDFSQSIKYNLLAVAAMEAQRDSFNYDCNIYYHAGLIQSAYGEYVKARVYLDKALHFAMKVQSPLRLGISQAIINNYYSANENEQAIKMIRYVERTMPPESLDDRVLLASSAFSCYLKEKDYPLAGKYEHELLQGFASYPVTDYRQSVIYGSLIGGYIETGRYKEAKKFAGYYEVYNKYYKSAMGLRSAYLWLSEAETGLGDYRSALMHFKMGTEINDSIYKSDKDSQISQLLAQYEDKKKQQDIQLLTRQTLLQNTQLQQTKLTKNVLWGSAGMLALLLGLGFNRYRLKQRTNIELQARQEEINKKNETLNQLVKEKEWLIKEMHHRVKNNLQIVMSLLNTQSMYLDNKAAQAAIQESQHRMHTISLIHQKLYQSDNSALVSMPAYVCELIDYLRESIDAGKNIHFEKQVADIELDVAQAIPVGLILNEAITNAIKYAFPMVNTGIITVSMKIINAGYILLQISDNGIGLSEENNNNKSGSLGMSLMEGLASQLGSDLSIINDSGVKIRLEFPYINDVNDQVK